MGTMKFSYAMKSSYAINKKIFILHGWTYSLDKWSVFTDLLKKAGFSPVFLKVPGLTTESNEIWDLKKYSVWLEKEISKEKGKIILLGHSNGGRIAAYFSVKHSDKIEKLILVDSAGIYHKGLLLQIKRFLFGTVAKIGKKFTDTKTLKNFLYRLAGEKDYQSASINMKKSMLNLIKVDLTPILTKIKVRTLIIWGENDKMTSLSDGILFNKLIENSQLEIVKGARHSPFYTHPKEVLDIIKNDF